MKPILVIGSINTDLVAQTLRLPRPGETVLGSGFGSFPGGKGANQAVAIAKLGFPVVLLGKVGRDYLGDSLLAALVSAGVTCDAIARSNAPSGVALINIEASGQNSIVVVPGANAELLVEDIDAHARLIRSAGMVLLQLEIPIATVEAACRIAGENRVPVMLDPAPPATLPSTLLQRVTWLTPNETEAAPLLGRAGTISSEPEARDAANQLLALGAKNVIIKMGVHGSYLASDGSRFLVPAFPVIAKDSTAAGDAYNAAFAVALLRGLDALDGARYASAAAAISVSRDGAQTSMPTQAEVERFLTHGAART